MNICSLWHDCCLSNIVIKTISEMKTEQTSAVSKWMTFIFNFPSNFIEKVWEGDDSLIAHFKGKFNRYYETYGPYGVIPAFYGDLSTSNQEKMIQWVLNNF